MKRITILFLSTALGLAVACGDNDEGGSGDTPDAMTDPPVETGTCTLIVGNSGVGNECKARSSALCGHSEDQLVGIPVFFHSPGGELIGYALTDVKGEASVDTCVKDTTVTFILNLEHQDQDVVTYTNVQPDDTVYYRVYPDYGPGPGSTFANVSVTGAADVSAFPEAGDSTRTWYADLGCEERSGNWRFVAGEDGDDYTGPQGPIEFTPLTGYSYGVSRCNLGQDQTTIDVLGRLYANSGVAGYAFVKDVAFTEGTDMDNMANNNITLPAWTVGDIDNAGLVTNLPANTYYSYNSFYQKVDGYNWASSGISDEWYQTEGELVPPVLSTTFEGLPDGFGEYSQSEGTWSLWYPGSEGLWTHNQGVDQFQMFTRTITLDASDRLPVITSLDVEDVDSAQPTMRWLSEEPIDGTIGAFWFQILMSADYACGSSCLRTVDWIVITPDTAAGEYTVPRLSEEFLELFEKRVVEIAPVGVQIFDIDTVSYGDVVGNPPFNPWDLADSYYGQFGYNIPLPPEGTEARVRRTRTFNYYHDDK